MYKSKCIIFNIYLYMVEFIAFINFYAWLLLFYGSETNVAILVKYETPKRGWTIV